MSIDYNIQKLLNTLLNRLFSERGKCFKFISLISKLNIYESTKIAKVEKNQKDGTYKIDWTNKMNE